MSDVPTPPNEDSKLLFKLLADRQWHSFYEIRDEIAKRVSPGRAIRAYEKDLNYRRQYRNDPDYNTTLNDDEREDIGRRKCASVAISAWKERGLDVRGEGREKQMRVKAGFVSWGIPGFEPQPGAEAPDPPPEAQGYTDPPPEDSVASGNGEPVEVADSSPLVAVRGPKEVVVVAPEPDTYLADVEEMHRAFLDDQVARLADQPVAEPDAVSQTVGANPETLTVTACQECGMGIVDEPLHRQWHEAESQENASDDMALLNESQLRDVVRDVMGQLLDDFQRGMQEWMTHEFSQLHAAVAVNRAPRAKWLNRSDHH